MKKPPRKNFHLDTILSIVSFINTSTDITMVMMNAPIAKYWNALMVSSLILYAMVAERMVESRTVRYFPFVSFRMA